MLARPTRFVQLVELVDEKLVEPQYGWTRLRAQELPCILRGKRAPVEKRVLVRIPVRRLQSGAGEEVVLIHLPEIWRTAAVLIGISVVIGPDAIPGSM